MKKIIKTLLYIYLPSLVAVFILCHISLISFEIYLSAISAILINFINLSAALFLYHLSINRSNQIFMILNLGGMGVRVFFMLLSFVLILIFLEIDTIAFILVFLIFYSLSMVIEIKYFNKTVQKVRK